MSRMDLPKFEAYISIDLPNPINKEIYDIRDRFCDKKMTVMPVDIPLFGQFDANMTMIRNIELLDEIISICASETKKKFKENERGPLISSHYDLDESGVVKLIFERNQVVDFFILSVEDQVTKRLSNIEVEMKAKQDENSLKTMDFLRGLLKDIDHLKTSKHYEAYVVVKSHMAKAELGTLDQKKLNMSVPLERITLYHKEAVPLTRLKSWQLNHEEEY